MTARDELQRWVEGGSWADQGYESELIPVDLARRVLAEMDAAQATLAEVRELFKSSVPIMLPADAIDFHRRLHEILDRSTP